MANAVRILQEFHNRLSCLYSSPDEFSRSQTKALFATLSLPCITFAQQADLDRQATQDKVANAIKRLKTNKWPGPMALQPHITKNLVCPSLLCLPERLIHF